MMTDTLTLTDALVQRVAQSSELGKTSAATLIKVLKDSGVVDRAIKVGDRAPDFALPSTSGTIVTLEKLLEDRPLVLSFYRGAWCPYCSAELDYYNAAAQKIQALGARYVAITPETGGRAVKTKSERRLMFDILCDVDGGVALEYGLLFLLPPALQQAYTSFGIDIPMINGSGSWFLPIPATYVIDRKGIVQHAFVDPDFRKREDPMVILNVISQDHIRRMA